MSNTNTTGLPAVNTSTQYAGFPTYIVAKPYLTVAAAASTVASSTDFQALHTTMLNNCAATLIALGYWATS
jgi:hypothetical protein